MNLIIPLDVIVLHARFILLFILFFIVNHANAQYVKVINDIRSRTSVGIEKELLKNVNIFGEAELGLEQDLSKVGKLKAEAGLNYSPYQFLELESSYRYSKNRKNYGENYKYTHTLALSAEAKHKIDRFRMSYRVQYQNIDDDATTYTELTQHRSIYKTRVRARYNIRKSKVTPFISTELYIANTRTGLNTSKLRSMAGIDFKPSKRDAIRVYYRNDRELSNFLPYTYHTLGFSYVLKL